MADKELIRLMQAERKAWKKVLVVLERMGDDAQRNLDILTAVKKGISK